MDSHIKCLKNPGKSHNIKTKTILENHVKTWKSWKIVVIPHNTVEIPWKTWKIVQNLPKTWKIVENTVTLKNLVKNIEILGNHRKSGKIVEKT